MKFNPQRYAGLLAEALPVVIETEAQNRRLLKVLKSLMSNGKREISKANAKALAKFFHTSTDVFL